MAGAKRSSLRDGRLKGLVAAPAGRPASGARPRRVGRVFAAVEGSCGGSRRLRLHFGLSWRSSRGRSGPPSCRSGAQPRAGAARAERADGDQFWRPQKKVAAAAGLPGHVLGSLASQGAAAAAVRACLEGPSPDPAPCGLSGAAGTISGRRQGKLRRPRGCRGAFWAIVAA